MLPLNALKKDFCGVRALAHAIYDVSTPNGEFSDPRYFNRVIKAVVAGLG